MRLRLSMRGPGVERIVNDKAVLQHLVIVWAEIAQTHGDGQETGRLRREVMPVGVRAER